MASRRTVIARLGAVIIALVLALLSGCGGKNSTGHGEPPGTIAADEPEKEYLTMQLFDDTGYERGFTVMGQDTVKKGNVLLGGEGLFNTVVTGPGKVWLQTMPINSLAMNLYAYMPHPSN